MTARQHHRPAKRPHQGPTVWQRLSRVLEAVIYVLMILIAARFFTPELDRQRALKAELRLLEQEKAEKKAAVDALRREYKNLDDKQYLETVARDRLNLQRKGEFIIQLERFNPPEN